MKQTPVFRWVSDLPLPRPPDPPHTEKMTFSHWSLRRNQVPGRHNKHIHNPNTYLCYSSHNIPYRCGTISRHGKQAYQQNKIYCQGSLLLWWNNLPDITIRSSFFALSLLHTDWTDSHTQTCSLNFIDRLVSVWEKRERLCLWWRWHHCVVVAMDSVFWSISAQKNSCSLALFPAQSWSAKETAANEHPLSQAAFVPFIY